MERSRTDEPNERDVTCCLDDIFTTNFAPDDGKECHQIPEVSLCLMGFNPGHDTASRHGGSRAAPRFLFRRGRPPEWSRTSFWDV